MIVGPSILHVQRRKRGRYNPLVEAISAASAAAASHTGEFHVSA